jgi:hypothetical protein
MNFRQIYIYIYISGIGFDLRTSLARNIALTTGIPLSIKKSGFLIDLLYTQNQKKNYKKKPLQQNNAVFHKKFMLIQNLDDHNSFSTHKMYTFLN